MAAGPGDEDVVRRFLHDVRAGRHLDRADHHLAPLVPAHQGRPGAVRGVISRTPEQYADHVRDMLRAVGPWTFDVRTVRRVGDLVEATWEQTGVLRGGPERGRPVVEHGWAAYRVADGRIAEYWIDAATEVRDSAPARGGPAGPDAHPGRGRRPRKAQEEPGCPPGSG